MICPPTYKPCFIELGKVLRNRSVIMPWSIEKLKNKWVPDVEVFYLGKASGSGVEKQTLRKRLAELVRHSKGKTIVYSLHKGGEPLW